MESLDLRVLADALQWRRDGHAVTLVTVVETWGSAPRPPGALLAVRDDGVVSGSVSGGCVEDDLIAQTQTAMQDRSVAKPPALDRPSMLAYGVSQEEAARFGLPCGGSLRLVREPLVDTTWVESLLDRTARHELVARQLTLATGEVRLLSAVRGQAMHFDGSVLTCVFGPTWRLLLIGAGQLSQAVAQIALMLDFEVLVCDPREEFAATLRLDGVKRVMGMPDDVVRSLVPDAHTAIVALTHDPKLDDMALLEALVSEAFYVGALGSRRNQASRKKRLAEHFGLTPEELARLHGPVGLFIGAKTPAEIAVSVMAHIVQVKNAALCVQSVTELSAC
ncbi:MAG: XdhC/CoxI family protein [Rhodoferax sp.]|uniref:XdhC family protein n=1 Tax=Rhodoferax sp. TaxID=50421 RepID=UPI003018FA7D